LGIRVDLVLPIEGWIIGGKPRYAVNHAESCNIERARLLKRNELPADWHPGADKRLTHRECAQHLIRVLDAKDCGEADAARLVAAMSPEDAEAARTLAYRLYDICEKKGWAQEAQAYNLLAEEFPHLEQAALDYEGERSPAQAAFDL
jgi:putative DNA methylase